MRQITPNIYVEDLGSVGAQYRGCNPSYINTSDGVVMVDTPMLPTDALKWRDQITALGKVRYIINTHHHLDHITGNSFFPGTVVSHEGVREMFLAPISSVSASERLAKAISEGLDIIGYIRWLIQDFDPPGLALLAGYKLNPPTVTFSEKLSLYVGQYTFQLLHLPGHTAAHIGVYIPQEKVLFTGDNFTSDTQPSFSHSVPLEWVKSLKKIEAMDANIIVPGHGRVCGKEKIREFRLFVEQCIETVREAMKKGMSKEEAADSISFEKFYPPVHPGPGMQRMNVMRIYEMLGKGKKS